ncbi:MAG: ABC-F family ATP-binding cassette domain-containing protein [Candidatus Nealsonbacteria bacterium]|nr:ABC-F family ATP-binding cassette domain-containing protein [Candidatus Nealsonbacteria bacterium]
MNQGETILRFNKVFFSYGHNKPILDEVDFSLRQGSKITLMGQNGAGKSTIFQLITGNLKPDLGAVSIVAGVTVAIAKQVISRDLLDLTVREFFQNCFSETVYDIDPKIDEVLGMVNLIADKDKIIKSFSGGQQARLLLASAIIQNPDLLLLDEPTNNLDKDGIIHLTKFLIDYNKTCIVISHDAKFLNAFTHGVLYLDVFTRKIEQYVGDYYDLLIEISARMERENMKNAQLAKKIQENKDKSNYFAHKGGKMRLVAKKMRQRAEEMEEAKIDVRKEDKTIRSFIIPSQQGIGGEILSITSFSVMKNHKSVRRKANISLRKGERLFLTGQNGSGKTTLLEALASGKAKGAKIASGVKVGYYRQDFSTLNLDDTVYQSLSSVAEKFSEENLRALAAGFLITGDLIYAKIGSLSEGQKGLVSFARLVIQKPGLLILDEPTNHINFRHLPVIASALNKYEGALVLVSHIPEFVQQIRIDEILDLNQ